jgi:hypothetical protein
VDEDRGKPTGPMLIVSSPRGQARRIVGRQGAVAGAYSRALLSQPAARRQAAAPLLVGGARSGKAFVSFVASWRAFPQTGRKFRNRLLQT